MEQNNPLPENKGNHTLHPLLVSFLGFDAAVKENFVRIFQVARLDQRRYIAANSTNKTRSEILLVNYDNPAALRKKKAFLAKHPQVQVVAVSRGPLTESPVHHIRGMLFAARVLTALDKVSIAARHEAASTEPQAVASPNTEQLVTPLVPQVAEIPVQSVQTTTEVDKPLPATIAAAPHNTGYRALVVDDSLAIQKSLEHNLATLPQIGVIDFADSGESAIEKAEVKQYDLIFLDVMMPGIDGYETCTRLRKKPEYKKTPIIMVSGKSSPLDEVKGIMSGCTTYLIKPVEQEAFQKLSARVLAWLERQKKPLAPYATNSNVDIRQ